MWHLELVLLIASCASFFLALTVANIDRPVLGRVHLVRLGLLLFVLVFTIQLART